MKRKSLTIGLTGLAGVVLCGGLLTLSGRNQPAHADATNYSNQKRAIRACVLVTEATQDADGGGATYPSNVTPHVFYALDSRTDLRPGNFEFVNPLAPQIITQDIYNRWLRRSNANGNRDRAFNNGTAEQQLFQVGSPCTKNMGAYWEVNLSKVTSTDLQQFDVVLMPMHGSRPGLGVQFTPAERERLRHYADQGGTIWMENAGLGSGAFGGGGFFEVMDTGGQPGANTPITVAAAHHPLLNYPYYISPQNTYGLSVQNSMNNNLFIDPTTNAAKAAYGGAQLQLSQATAPILRKGGATTVYAGDIGAGHLLVTSASIAGDINNYMISGNAQGVPGSSVIGVNDGAVCGSNLQGIPPTDLKFAYNLASWISSVPTPGSNQRRTGSTQENIGSTLAVKWSPLPLMNPANVGSGATIYKGLTYWVDGNNFLHAFDTNPQQSLSGNGNPDDGIPDFIYGFPYDEVWNDKGARILPDPNTARGSTPTVVTVTDPSSNTILEALALQDTQGSFYVVPMALGGQKYTTNTQITIKRATGDMQPSLVTTPTMAGAMPKSSSGAPFGNPFPKPVPAPAYSDGVLFGLTFNKPQGRNGELGWRIEAIDLLTTLKSGNPSSVFGGDTGDAAVPNPSTGSMGLPGFYNPQGNLTVGEVKDPNSDAVDKIVYVPIAANDTAQTAGVIRTAWFSTRSERLRAGLLTNFPAEFPIGRTFVPSGNRARIPWYVGGNSPSNINLNPVVHIVTYNGTVATGIQTLTYPNDFTVSYKADGEYALDDPNDPTSTKNPTVPAGARMHVILNNVTPNPSTDVVYVDYTVDWPGAPINGVTPSPLDLALIMARQYQTFPQTYGAMTPEFSGGVALSGDDNLLMAVTNLRGGTGVTGSTDIAVPDRVFNVRDSYIGVDSSTVRTNLTGQSGPPARPRQEGPYVNWMFSPNEGVTLDSSYGGGAFNGYQVRPRLLDPINKQPIYNFKAVGSPISSNGTVYVLGMGYRTAQSAGTGSANQPDYTVLLALRENVDASIDVGPVTDTAVLTLVQPSLINPSGKITLTQDNEFTLERVPDTINGGFKGIAHILRFQQIQPGGQTNTDTFNLALPIWVQDATAGQGTLTIPPKVNPVTGVGILDNLQYYVVIPTNENRRAAQCSRRVCDQWPVRIGQYAVLCRGRQLARVVAGRR